MSSRATVGWALLLSVPPGVGVTGYATMVIGEGLVEPMALVAGGLTAGVIFALVVASRATGSAGKPPAQERDD